jgi:hypothetical protein
MAVRDQFTRLLNTRLLLGQGAEIGTHRGAFAATILQSWNGTCLSLVDPWKNTDVSLDDRAIDKQWAMNRVEPYCDRVRVLAMTSAEAAKHLGQLDFVYIDALHTYDAVVEDIALWWPHITPHGILAGHDFSTRHFPGVVKAVCEFAARENRPVYITHEVDYASWYIYRNDGVIPFRWWYSQEVAI